MVYVACNPLLIKTELEYQLNDSQARISVISDEMLPVLREIVRENRTNLEKVAFVSVKEGAAVTAEELMEFVNGQVAPYKKLREVRFIEKMPLFATGKLNRRALMDML